jgi:enoyl-CoA hydratase
MTESLVLVADHGAVRLLTMNRPAARNALTRDLIRAIYTALTEPTPTTPFGLWC